MLSVVLSIIGLSLAPIGIVMKHSLKQKVIFLLSACFMLVASIMEQNYYYIALEILTLIATLLPFSSLTILHRIIALLFLSMIFSLYLFINSYLDKPEQILGAFGLITLALGYGTLKQNYLLFGSMLISIYSLTEYLQTSSYLPLVFLLLNLVFVLTIIINRLRVIQIIKKIQ